MYNIASREGFIGGRKMKAVTLKTKDVGEVRCSVTVINNNLGDVKDMWIGDNNSGLERCNIEYIKRSLRQ